MTAEAPQQERAYRAWLPYFPCQDAAMAEAYRGWCGMAVVDAGGSAVTETALQELRHGLQAMLGCEPARVHAGGEESSAMSGRFLALGVLGGSPLPELAALAGTPEAAELGEDGYLIRTVHGAGRSCIALAGHTERGLLYAVFHFLRMLQTGAPIGELSLAENPRGRLRMMNQWDNMDGSVERGYAGSSIFYENGAFAEDLTPVRDYARLLASIGLNALSINNVNVHQMETGLIAEPLLSRAAEVADILRAYGIRLFLSINFAAPLQLGGPATADPLDAGVREWWARRAEEIYRRIPDFGGFLVKADSEFRPGPFTYGRDHKDGANMLADALQPYGGLVIWRCFVYNCLQDWRDRSTDRARAAYDHFMPLDGAFRDNVILQIKNGPMDFQVREPVSPLIGGLTRTNQVLELQIAQEYTGQQRHLCYLVPQWKAVLDFDTHALGEGTTVARLASGEAHARPHGGFAAVSNIGSDANWTGHTLAQANLYGYGRLVWDPALSAEAIAREWAQMTFGGDAEVTDTVCRMLLGSWETYERYTAPLGVGWMVQPGHHYGPSVDGYEYSKWGTYHFADCSGIGVDRTAATGTGFAGQFHPPNAQLYESLESCPDELLLFFHNVPYTHVLKSGRTVIQHIYDTHFQGAEEAAQLARTWMTLEGRIEEETYAHVLGRLQEQAAHAEEWRDVINTYFLRKSGIPDAQGRRIY